jgi:hypothetical protein
MSWPRKERTGRAVLALLVGTLSGALLVVTVPLAPPALAASASVATEAELRNAFEDGDVTEIDLTNDIAIEGDNCDNATFIRQSATALVVDGHGFTVTQTCPLQVFLQLECTAHSRSRTSRSRGAEPGHPAAARSALPGP